MKKHSSFLLAGIILLGVCMRMPITAIPSVIKPIAASFHVVPNSLGILTTIPLICFAILSSPVSSLAQRWGNELVLAVAMLIMAIGSWLRIFSFTSMIIGTILVGAAITCINVLLPPIIADHYPQQIGSVTGAYNVSMSLFAAIGAYAITPITNHSSWQLAVILLTVIIVITLLVWLPNLRFNSRGADDNAESAGVNMWKHPGAWMLLFYFGLQSFIFYAVVAWLPSIATDAGLSNDQASIVAGLFQLFSIPFAFITPVLAGRMADRRPLFLLAGGLPIIATAMMYWHTSSFAYFVIVTLLMGIGSSTAFALSMTLFSLKTRTAADTRNLSSMVQTVGYLIAATGPVILGRLNAITHGWDMGLTVLILVSLFVIIFGFLAERHQYID